MFKSILKANEVYSDIKNQDQIQRFNHLIIYTIAKKVINMNLTLITFLFTSESRQVIV